ncbi:MAG: hypothetical protein WAX14_12195 [Rhodococcus sp. (in: high G+C Gram-positive bacteria)]|uniref:hypothetical protein n=1 Tax=Rhodococcus sp. TaxID=1831 RepID=UPI003BB70BE8
MVFEVKATHRVRSTGDTACEVHPDVFIDQRGRVFTTAETVVEHADIPAGIHEIGQAEDHDIFVVEDAAIELAIDWIEVLSDDSQAEERIEQKSQSRWATSSGPVQRMRPDIDWTSLHRQWLRRDRRIVEFEVRASHRSDQDLTCEIYPDVFVAERSRAAFSRLAGMAMQQPGDIVAALPEGTQEWFTVHGLENATSWVGTVAAFQDEFWLKHHGGDLFFPRPVGPMGPSCPPRSVLSC